MKQIRLFIVFLAAGFLTLTACTDNSNRAGGAVTDIDEATPALPFLTEFALASPDGELRIELGIDDLGRASYRVMRDQAAIVRDSTLGLETTIGSFTTTTTLEAIDQPELTSETLEVLHGKARSSTVESNRQTVRLDDIELDIWIANTGVAFRYRLNKPGETFQIDWERTSFAMPQASRTWLQQHDAPGLVTPAYEHLRSREASASNPGRSRYGWTFPALFEHEGSWTLITETALGDGAGGSHFSPATDDATFLLDFANRGEGNGVGDPRPRASDTWTSPWRLIITSTDLGDIVESDLVRHLSPPPAGSIASFDWVDPGRVSWSWWSDDDSPQDPDLMEPFIDLAAEMSWEYSLVDANWNLVDPGRIDELVDYANDRGIGLFFWYNSGGPNNAYSEQPRDLMTISDVRRAEMRRLRELGVVGIKVDFFHSDKPDVIQLYRDILQDAADAELMVHFHGSTVPRGWSREFPNLMTMEAVRGAEIYKFDPTFQRFAAWQNTVLPFTRNVVGPMDYTPVILGDEVRRMTTNSHELALSVVFESGLLHLVDTPEAYLSQPDVVVDLLSTIPVVWDETKFVDGRPGSHIVIARRSGQTWWVGAINGTDEFTLSAIDLDLLGIDPTQGIGLAQVCDNPEWDRFEAGTYLDPTQYNIVTGNAPGRIDLALVANGGCLVRLAPNE